MEDTLRTMDGIDAEKVITDADTYARKGKALLPLRPVFVANDQFCKIFHEYSFDIESSDWPMVNMRAKEAERAAHLF